jgi:hypothetical protein
METLFESSDTGSKIVLMSNGTHLRFVIDGEVAFVMTDIQFLEVFRLSNAVWYSQLVRKLNMCWNGNCQNKPTGCHVRQNGCPEMTPYEAKTIVANNNGLRNMHLETTRAPIPDGTISDSAH